jgi:hypothetical protein
VGTPTGPPPFSVCGRPTVRKAQLPGGMGMTREANADGRKAAGNHDDETPPPPGGSLWITGRIPGLVPGRESGLTRVR